MSWSDPARNPMHGSTLAVWIAQNVARCALESYGRPKKLGPRLHPRVHLINSSGSRTMPSLHVGLDAHEFRAVPVGLNCKQIADACEVELGRDVARRYGGRLRGLQAVIERAGREGDGDGLAETRHFRQVLGLAE